MILRWAFLIFILLALIACAKPPLFEKKTAEHVIAQAKALDAQQYAPTEYQAALEAFRDGQALMDQGNYRAAGDALEFATFGWVEWFNHRRLFGPIGWVPPVEFEEAYWQSQADAAEEPVLK